MTRQEIWSQSMKQGKTSSLRGAGQWKISLPPEMLFCSMQSGLNINPAYRQIVTCASSKPPYLKGMDGH